MQVPAHRGRHRRRPVVALPAAVARPVDDVVAGDQPAAVHRRARRHDAVRRTVARPRTTCGRRGWPASGWCRCNTGWHLAHHVDMGVPWRNLPKLHAELEAAGYVTPELTYPSYRALGGALRSRPES